MEKLRNYLLGNMDELMDAVRELNSWNGCLEHLEVFENDEEFFDMFELVGLNLAQRIFYGSYNPNDCYVRFDAYGNLDSLSTWEYEEELKVYIDEIIENLIEYKHELSLCNELDEILQEMEMEVEEE